MSLRSNKKVVGKLKKKKKIQTAQQHVSAYTQQSNRHNNSECIRLQPFCCFSPAIHTAKWPCGVDFSPERKSNDSARPLSSGCGCRRRRRRFSSGFLLAAEMSGSVSLLRRTHADSRRVCVCACVSFKSTIGGGGGGRWGKWAEFCPLTPAQQVRTRGPFMWKLIYLKTHLKKKNLHRAVLKKSSCLHGRAGNDGR